MVLEEEKQQKLGWSFDLKATPRKGGSKKIEEEEKFHSSKKILFDMIVSPTVKDVALVSNPLHEVVNIPNNILDAGLINENINVSHDIPLPRENDLVVHEFKQGVPIMNTLLYLLWDTQPQ